MSKGEVPIPYIIALVLAIVVIGLVVYWLYFTNVDFLKTINEYSCRSKKDAYCNQWKLSGAAPKPFFASSPADECPVSQGIADERYAPECCEFSWATGDLRTSCGIGEPTTTTTLK
jgi:hypothetical protein